MPLEIRFQNKSTADQYCAITNAKGVEIIPIGTGKTIRFKTHPLLTSLKHGQFKLAQEQHNQTTIVTIPNLPAPQIAKIIDETFTCNIEPPENAADWINDSDDDEFSIFSDEGEDDNGELDGHQLHDTSPDYDFDGPPDDVYKD